MVANKERNLEYIKEFEQEHNLSVKVYGDHSIFPKWMQSNQRNAYVNLWFRRWKRPSIHIGNEIVEKVSLNILKYVLYHELGHIKYLRWFSSEVFADAYSLNHSGLSVDAFCKAVIQMKTFYEFSTLDLEELKKLEHLSTWNDIKMHLGILQLDKINLDNTKNNKMDHRKLLNKKDPLDRIILEEGEKGSLSIDPVGLKGVLKRKKS